MRNLRNFLLVFLVAIFPHLPVEGATTNANEVETAAIPAPITDTEMGLIEEMLATCNLTTEDTGFEKKWADDGNRLSIVNHLMDNPLDTPNYIHEQALKVREAGNNIRELLRLTAEPLDLQQPQAIYKEVARLTTTPRALAETAMGVILQYREALGELRKSAQISDEDWRKLIYSLPYVWLEEDHFDELGYGKELGEFVLAKGLGENYPIQNPPEKLEGQEILNLVNRISRQDFLNLADRFAHSCDYLIKASLSLREAGEHMEVSREIRNVSGDVLGYAFDKGLSVIVGGTGSNTYYANFDVVIDLGGNDTYYARQASGINQPQILIDLGGANDIYLTGESFAFGSAGAGLAYFYDDGGNDTYRASSYSLGSALLGYAFFLDEGGNDIYQADVHTEGAGTFGVCIFVDGSGNDSYNAALYSQAFGSVWGYGMLADFAGNDRYYAGGKFLHQPLYSDYYQSLSQGFGFGWRGTSSGGIALLYDKSGNDFYETEIYGQGSSYWYALGMLVDDEGNDFYSSVHYSQGAGIHLSVGGLIDRAGKDSYSCHYGPCQGTAHDLAVGVLVDYEGEDWYITNGVGQGSGWTNSFGLLLDKAGDDAYMGKGLGYNQGMANETRGFGGIGLFLDLGGKDVYNKGAPPDNDKLWHQGRWGIGRDLNSEPKEAQQ